MSGTRSSTRKRSTEKQQDTVPVVDKVPSKKKKPIYMKHSDSEESDEEVNETQLRPAEGETETKLPAELLKKMTNDPGYVLISGMVSWDFVNKKISKENNRQRQPNLYSFHKFTERKYRLVVSGCVSAHSVLVSEEGTAYTFGRNLNGQLGLGDTETKSAPEPVKGLENITIIHAATGRHHTLFLSDAGVVYACGDNRSGQCGVGNSTKELLTPHRIDYTGPPIVKVGCGAEFSLILDCNGDLHSFGLPEYGQLGHNTDGKFFLTSSRLAFNFEKSPRKIASYVNKMKDGKLTTVPKVEIVDFSCGAHHTVAIDTMKRVFSWGFGGYGRLGHAETKDEIVPRLIKFFSIQNFAIRSVHCGYSYTIAVNDQSIPYLFGQTKSAGEANMYPKVMQDLAGLKIKHVGTSHTSFLVSEGENLIVVGPSPTYGELGSGELIKSTTKPIDVKYMKGVTISQITMGFSHTLLLCNDASEVSKEKLDNLRVFNP